MADDRIPIETTLREELRALRARTGWGADALISGELRDRADLFERGLTASVIETWLDGSVRTADPVLLSAVLEAYRNMPEHLWRKNASKKRRPRSKPQYEPLGEEIREELRRHKQRTQVGSISLLRTAQNVPSGLNPSAIDRDIAALNDRIADAEDRFVQDYGESWREDLAHEILDEIPERQEGETLAAYRERLEKDLIEEMLDENGNIKDEYRGHDDARMRDYARWAKDSYDRDRAIAARDVLRDPNASEAERQAVLSKYEERFGRTQEATHVAAVLSDNEQAQVDVQESDDVSADKELNDKSSQAGLDASDFGNSFG